MKAVFHCPAQFQQTFSLFHPGGITSNMFSGVWYGHWGTVECRVILVKVLLAFEQATDKIIARPFSSWKCPCQTFEAWHSHLAPGTAQASGDPKLARGIWVTEEFYCEGICVKTKPLKFWKRSPRRSFPWPKIQEKEKRTGRWKGKNPKAFLTAAAILAIGVLSRGIGLQISGSESNPWMCC